MKGFIHVYECEESLVKDFKEFASKHSCDRYNSALRYLLDFYETFHSFLKQAEKIEKKEIEIEKIELEIEKKQLEPEIEKKQDKKPKGFGRGN